MPSTSPEPRRCPHCGARVAQQAHSCLLCGQQLPTSTYLAPALALLAVAVVGGIVIAGLRDRSAGPSATSTPARSTAVAMAPATVPATPDTPAGETPAPPTATLAPPTATSTAVPTETPTLTPTATPSPTVGPRVHIVQSGDVLSTIAQEYGLGVDDILAVNPNLTEYSMLRVGQEIVIPAAESAGAATEPAAPAVHVVKSGDNLAYLA
ncbi:MAG: LysM peptidoglycan-binding domain-containing protein, partial [Anaerolineaceae bacterium]|nr:LysM peptidoglycan-binding domain-containing protein [Anaerolineaceae bacterium]